MSPTFGTGMLGHSMDRRPSARIESASDSTVARPNVLRDQSTPNVVRGTTRTSSAPPSWAIRSETMEGPAAVGAARLRRAAQRLSPLRLLPFVVIVAAGLAGVLGSFSSETSGPAAGTPGIASPAVIPAGPLASSRTVDALDLRPGDCVEISPDEAGLVAAVEVVDCRVAHAYEAFAVRSHAAPAGDPYPGAEALQAEAERACLDAFAPYVGRAYDRSSLFVSWIGPSPGSWTADERRIVCLMSEANEQPTTGSLKGANR